MRLSSSDEANTGQITIQNYSLCALRVSVVYFQKTDVLVNHEQKNGPVLIQLSHCY